MHELEELLNEEFSEARVRVIQVPRECNNVAHELARSGSLNQDDIFFFYSW